MYTGVSLRTRSIPPTGEARQPTTNPPQSRWTAAHRPARCPAHHLARGRTPRTACRRPRPPRPAPLARSGPSTTLAPVQRAQDCPSHSPFCWPDSSIICQVKAECDVDRHPTRRIHHFHAPPLTAAKKPLYPRLALPDTPALSTLLVLPLAMLMVSL